jgi:hypothetical protein
MKRIRRKPMSPPFAASRLEEFREHSKTISDDQGNSDRLLTSLGP